MKAILVLISSIILFSPPRMEGCSDIESTFDKGQNKKIIKSPLSEQVAFIKVIKRDKIAFYISLSTTDRTKIEGTGVEIRLSGGSKISKSDAQVESTPQIGGVYEVYSMVALSPLEVKTLSHSSVSGFTLYTVNQGVDNGDKYKAYLNCILDRK